MNSWIPANSSLHAGSARNQPGASDLTRGRGTPVHHPSCESAQGRDRLPPGRSPMCRLSRPAWTSGGGDGGPGHGRRAGPGHDVRRSLRLVRTPAGRRPLYFADGAAPVSRSAHSVRMPDSRSISHAPFGPPASADLAVFDVALEPQGPAFLAGPDESILDAALRQGVALSYGCRNGACGACRGRVIAGRVHLPEGTGLRGLTEREVRAGWTLLCQARASSDLRIAARAEGAGDGVRTLPARVASRTRLAHDVMELRLQLPSDRAPPVPGRPVRRHPASRRAPTRVLPRQLPGGRRAPRAPHPPRAGRDVLRTRLRGPRGSVRSSGCRARSGASTFGPTATARWCSSRGAPALRRSRPSSKMRCWLR